MYDNVKFWIDRHIVGENYNSVAKCLDSAKEITDLKTGERRKIGGLGGLKVSIFESGISIQGSLPKFLNGGSNICTLNRHSTNQAIEKISDCLHIDINLAKVTSIEFGAIFMMEKDVCKYLSKFGDMPRYNRCQFNSSTLYYRGAGKQQAKGFIFYDKISDLNAKKMEYPEDLADKNLLKYEMRLNGRLANQLRVPEVRGSTLAQMPFYKKMVELYQNYYLSISKNNQVKENVMSEIKTVADAYNVLVAIILSQTDQEVIKSFIEEIKSAEPFNRDKKNLSRLKKKIREVTTRAELTSKDELIRELDDDIKNVGAYI